MNLLLTDALDKHEDIMIEILQKTQEALRLSSDNAEQSFLCGKIGAMKIYDLYLGALLNNYGFISKEFLEEKSGPLTDDEFREWVAEQQDWLQDNQHLPDSAEYYGVFLEKCAETVQDMMSDPERFHTLYKDIDAEYPGALPGKITEGLDAFIKEINIRGQELLPNDAPAVKPAAASLFQLIGPSLKN